MRINVSRSSPVIDLVNVGNMVGLIDHDAFSECGIMKSLTNGHEINIFYEHIRLNLTDG